MPDILIKCFELFILSFTILEIKLAGIKEKAVAIKRIKIELLTSSVLSLKSLVKGNGWCVKSIFTSEKVAEYYKNPIQYINDKMKYQEEIINNKFVL